ncbi:MAG TPA: polysaccharide pyruvyl transferase [Pasteurellaceae bacterium]|nr:polysaccharide pyruvyl transferase [Pasteurellaceae bacterium]
MNDILFSLKQELGKISEVITDKKDVLYFDYPLHLNVGDLLIYAGTEAFFKDYDINIRLRRCLQTFDINEVKKYVNKNTTILCHGGGNFGDLYPLIQQLREELVTHFPHNRIIVLPQTGFFSSSTAMHKAAAIFSQHKDCYLFARDLPTLELMKNFSDKVQLSPDMAHQLYGTLPSRTATEQSTAEKSQQEILYFLRKDIEASQLEERLREKLTSATIKDWDDILQTKDIRFEKICSKVGKLANRLNLSWLKNMLNDIWYKYALNIIARSQAEFLRYDMVVTSRLHGHIFSCLLGIPNRVCDNAYGKNMGYYNQWTKGIHYAEKYED